MNTPSEYYEPTCDPEVYTDEQVAIMNAHVDGVREALEELIIIRNNWDEWNHLSKSEQLDYIGRAIGRHQV